MVKYRLLLDGIGSVKPVNHCVLHRSWNSESFLSPSRKLKTDGAGVKTLPWQQPPMDFRDVQKSIRRYDIRVSSTTRRINMTTVLCIISDSYRSLVKNWEFIIFFQVLKNLLDREIAGWYNFTVSAFFDPIQAGSKGEKQIWQIKVLESGFWPRSWH